MRFARMPFVYFDKAKSRFFVQIKMPKDLQAEHGSKPFVYKFTQDVNRDTANDRSIEIVKGFKKQIADLRQQALPDPPLHFVWRADRLANGDPTNLPWMGHFERVEPGTTVVAPDILFTERGEIGRDTKLALFPIEQSYPTAPPLRAAAPSEPQTATALPLTPVDAVAVWVAGCGKKIPKNRAIRNKENRVDDMLEFVSLRRGLTIRLDDLTAVTIAEAQAWKDHLVKTNDPEGNVARDHLDAVKGVYTAARKENKFLHLERGDPFGWVALPPRMDPKAKRLVYTPAEAKMILLAAQRATPTIKHLVYACAFLGTIISEISDLRVAHFQVSPEGIPFVEITPEGRTQLDREGRTRPASLKADERMRQIPLHPALIAVGLLDRVAEARSQRGSNAYVFEEIAADTQGMRNTTASDLLIKFLRDLGIENELDETGERIGLRDNYSWRKMFATALENIATTDDRRRYLCGHATKDLHAKRYLEHPVAITFPIIEQIADQTALEIDPVEKAA